MNADYFYATLLLTSWLESANRKDLAIYVEQTIVVGLAGLGYKVVDRTGSPNTYHWKFENESTSINLDWNPKDGTFELVVIPQSEGEQVILWFTENTLLIPER